MRVFAISDLHLSINNPKPMNIFGKGWDNYTEKIFADWNERVSGDDLVLLPGDLSWAMRLNDALPDLQLIAAQKGRKVLIRGNHDYWWNGISKLRAVLPESVFAIQNDAIRFSFSEGQDVVIFGTRGWLSEDNLSEADQKIYNSEVERLRLTIAAAEKLRQNAATVCMMHFPPFNVQRQSSPLTDLIEQFNPTAVVYGHLHGKNCRADLTTIKGGIPYHLTSCDLLSHKLTQIL